MDGDNDLESQVTADGALTIDDQTSYVSITELPISQSSGTFPSVERKFRRPVRITALRTTLRSTSQPGEGTTTTPAPEQQPAEATVTLLTKKPGDTNFTPLLDEATNQPKVLCAITAIFNG